MPAKFTVRVIKISLVKNYKLYEKKYNPTIILTKEDSGLLINEGCMLTLEDIALTSFDGSDDTWLATPVSGDDGAIYCIRGGTIDLEWYNASLSYYCCLRPVVCLKASTPAREGTETDIALGSASEAVTFAQEITSAEGKISLKSIEWIDGKANITIEKSAYVDDSLTIEYSIDNGATYNSTTGNITGIANGTTVLVRLTDGSNYGDTASIIIEQ